MIHGVAAGRLHPQSHSTTGWKNAPSTRKGCGCPSKKSRSKHLGIIGLEFLDAGIGQGVVQHLLDDLVGHRGNVRTGQRTVRHMDGIAHAGGDDLRLDVGVVQEHIVNGLHQLDARTADVIQPPQERADVGSTRAGGNSGAGLRIFRQTGKIPNNPKQTEAANVVFVGIDKKGLRFLNRLL